MPSAIPIVILFMDPFSVGFFAIAANSAVACIRVGACIRKTQPLGDGREETKNEYFYAQMHVVAHKNMLDPHLDDDFIFISFYYSFIFHHVVLLYSDRMQNMYSTVFICDRIV